MLLRSCPSVAETVLPAAVLVMILISFFFSFLKIDTVDLVQIPALLMHMQQFVFVCSEEPGDITAQILGRTDHKSAAFFGYPADPVQFSQEPQEPVIARFC